MAAPYFDITRKLQEFGFGPSDSESEEEQEDHNVPKGEQSQSIASDWESIGLLPSSQKLQINFRNGTYSFMTGLRRESIDANANGASTHSEIASKKPQSMSETDISQNKNFDPEHVGENGKILTHNEDIKTGGNINHENEENEKREKEDGHFSGEKQAISAESHDSDNREAQTERKNPQESAIEDDTDEELEEVEEEEAEEEEEEDEEDEDEWEEIGRLPRLTFPFRSPTDMMNFPSVFNYQYETSFSTSRGLGWQNLMPNFQLPSFFDETHDSESELEDINDPLYADVFPDTNLTEEDKVVGYNEEGLTGCPHYLRNCKSECSQCHRFYMCQLCHDEVESHHMNRENTRRMSCLHCFKPQPPRKSCRFCKEIMGDYYCKVCKLWNDDPDKAIYHCDKCGICRVGRGLGIDVFHCDKCGICMNLVVMNNHKCIEQAARSDCPICLEDLFTSPRPTVFMPCGHPIHKECFDEYSKRYYRCPVCSRSILNTSALFRMIDEEIQYEVLPPELADKLVNILCQDCHSKSQTRYHLAGLKCETCGSYNTAQS